MSACLHPWVTRGITRYILRARSSTKSAFLRCKKDNSVCRYLVSCINCSHLHLHQKFWCKSPRRAIVQLHTLWSLWLTVIYSSWRVFSLSRDSYESVFVPIENKTKTRSRMWFFLTGTLSSEANHYSFAGHKYDFIAVCRSTETPPTRMNRRWDKLVCA